MPPYPLGQAAAGDLSADASADAPATFNTVNKLDRLREMGVLVGSYKPHPPKAGGGADRYRWDEVLELLALRVSARS